MVCTCPSQGMFLMEKLLCPAKGGEIMSISPELTSFTTKLPDDGGYINPTKPLMLKVLVLVLQGVVSA